MNTKVELGANDNAVTTDSLGCEKYYKGIKDFVLNCDTPMTVAIEGDWGSGKTSAMNIMKNKIISENNLKTGDGKNPPYIIVDYNVWEYSKYGMEKLDVTWLNVGLYYALCEACNKNITGETLRNKFTKAMGNIFTAAISLKGSEAAADVVAVIVEGVKNKTYSIERVLKEIKNIASEEYKKGNRIIIFIDDLDRLQPEAAVNFLEYVKLFMDCEGMVFVLAVDFEVVYSGVKAKYGENIKEEKAKQFFDKIIQLPFEVPVLQYDITKIVENCIGNNSDTKRYSEVIEVVLSNNKNPRTIKRAFNMHSLYKKITELDNNSYCKQAKKVENYEFYLFVIGLLQVAKNDLYKKMLEMAKKDSVPENDEAFTYLKSILSDEEMPNFIKVLDYFTNVFGKSNDDRFEAFRDKMQIRAKRKTSRDIIRGSVFNELIAKLESDLFIEYEIDVVGNYVYFNKDNYSFAIEYKPKNNSGENPDEKQNDDSMNDITLWVSSNYDRNLLTEKGIKSQENITTSQNKNNELGYSIRDKRGKEYYRFNTVLSYMEKNEGSMDCILQWLLRE